MLISIGLLQEFILEIENEIVSLEEDIVDESWEDIRGYWSSIDTDLSSEDMDKHFEELKLGHINDLRIAEGILSKANRELEALKSTQEVLNMEASK